MSEEEQLNELSRLENLGYKLQELWRAMVAGDIGKTEAIRESRRVLEEAGCVQLSEDQSLPDESVTPTSSVPRSLILSMTSYARRIQQNMLAANFRRIKK